MAKTSLYDPGTAPAPAPAPSTDPTSDQFGKVMGIFNPPKVQPQSTTGQASQGSYIATEPVTGNSLDQITRSITNMLGTSGASTFGSGTNVFGAGLGVADTGLSLFGQPLEYWQKLLSGDQQSMTEAVQPEAQAASTAYGEATRQAQTGLAKGGYASTTLAGLPFKQAGDIQTLVQKLRPQAAGAVSDIAGKVTGAGEGLASLGMGEQGLGLQQIMTALQGLLSRREQNVQETAAVMGMIGQIARGVGDVLGAKLAG